MGKRKTRPLIPATWLAVYPYCLIDALSQLDKDLFDGKVNKVLLYEANKMYAHKEPELATILHFADLWATKQEKYNEVVNWK